jgi:WD40 repeat protein
LITIWSTIKWALIITFNHGTGVLSFAVLQNSKYLISAGNGGFIKLWDYKTGQLMKTFNGFPSSIVAFQVLNNGDLITGSTVEFTAKIWNSNSGAIKYTLNQQSYILALFQLKNESILTISHNGKIQTWNPSNGSLIDTKNIGISLTAAAYLINEDIFIGNNTGGLRIYNSTSLQLKYTLVGHTSTINKLIQLKNGDLASCSADRTVRIWDWNTKQLKYTLSAYMSHGLTELANGYLVSGGLDFKLNVWK